MKKNIIVGISIILALLLVIGGYFAYKNIDYDIEKDYKKISDKPSNQLTISNFAFSPATINVNVGDTITWTNKDSALHTITSDSGSELSSSTLSNDQTYQHTFDVAGTYEYHCSIHTSMKGAVIVSYSDGI